MAAHTDDLLRYRPWRGQPRGPLHAAVALARMSLRVLSRQRLLWGLFGLGLLVFSFFFYAQYLVVWITNQLGTETVRFAGIPVTVTNLTKFLDRLNLNGTAHTFGNFIWFQGYVLVIVLAFAGSVFVGNDFAHGSLPYYLSKPIGRRHYLLGKCLAVGALINVFVTLPAVVLWVEAGLLFDWETYYLNNVDLLLGVFGYGSVLTVTLSLLVVATAIWVRRTVPMVMVWMGIFAFLRMLGEQLARELETPAWRLLDLWNSLYLCGLWCLGVEHETIRPVPQPRFWQAWLAVAGVSVVCLLYLRRRIQAVEIVQ